jgi:SAM-dependent methyltransferase
MPDPSTLASRLSENNLALIPDLRAEIESAEPARLREHWVDAEQNVRRCLTITSPLESLVTANPGQGRRLRVLEVGLGFGHVTTTLRYRFGDSLELFALEHPESERLDIPAFADYVAEAQINLELVDLLADELPWPENFFDAIFLAEVIEHLPSTALPELLRSLAFRLAPDGVTVIASENLHGIINRVRFMLGRGVTAFPSKEHGSYGHITLYGKGDMLTLPQVGLTVDRFDFYNWEQHYISRRQGLGLAYLAQRFLPALVPSFSTSWFLVASRSS